MFSPSQVDEEPDPISLGVCGVGQPPLGLKRKAETPLGSPPEPGQVLQQQEDEGRAGRYKIRVKDLAFPPKVRTPFSYACLLVYSNIQVVLRRY